MNRLPIFFGYAGALPFVLLMLLSLAADTDRHLDIVTTLQMSYATMILSFLGGVHWGQALPSGNGRQLSFAMVPTVAGLLLMGWAIWIDPFTPLLGAAGLFWFVYWMDRTLMPLDHIPEGYFIYRRNLTIIVSATLLVSFLFIAF